MDYESFNTYIEEAIKNNWERIALSDFDGVSYHYKDIARKIAKIHLLLESAEIKKGDKVAICGKNSAHWAVAFFANGNLIALFDFGAFQSCTSLRPTTYTISSTTPRRNCYS